MARPSPHSKPLADARVLVLTGAGVSAESGIATFRGAGGLWRNFDPAKLATAAAFERHPAVVWDWYRERRRTIRDASPNAAHVAVTQLARTARDFLLITQNVDDLHERARWARQDLPAGQMVRIHGDIFATRCIRCDFERRETTGDGTGVPACPVCGAALRPGVVWFGETLPAAEVARVQRFLGAGPCDLVVVIGTTALFGYIIDWAVSARGRSGRLVEVNLEETAMSPHATLVVREPAALALPRLVSGWSSQLTGLDA